MDLWTIIRTVVRRWYVLVPLVGLVVAGAVVVTAKIGPTFDTSSVVLVVGPNQEATPGPTGSGAVNPLLSFNAGLNITGVVLTQVVGGSEERDQIRLAGLVPDYSLVMDPRAPIIVLLVEGNGRDKVVDTAKRVSERLDFTLEKLQDEDRVPEAQRIKLKTLVPPDHVSSSQSNRVRALIGLVALGLAASIVVALLFDGIAATRAQKKRRSSGDADLDQASRTAGPSEVIGVDEPSTRVPRQHVAARAVEIDPDSEQSQRPAPVPDAAGDTAGKHFRRRSGRPWQPASVSKPGGSEPPP